MNSGKKLSLLYRACHHEIWYFYGRGCLGGSLFSSEKTSLKLGGYSHPGDHQDYSCLGCLGGASHTIRLFCFAIMMRLLLGRLE